jgi:hypothetical protein
VEGPELPDDVQIGQLDREVRARLRGLSKENAEVVGRHLVMTGRLLDSEPELAYEHAQAAVRRGGRVDVVREAAGLAAYRTGRFADALRELRTVRRLNGSSEHLPVMADSERGLGRPERALALAQSPEAATLDAATRTELAIVVSGARLDLGEVDAAGAVLDAIPRADVSREQVRRVQEARLAVLEAAGATAEAEALRSRLGPEAPDRPAEDVVVFDLDEDDLDESDFGEDAVDDAPQDTMSQGRSGESDDADGAPEGEAAEDEAQ